MIPVPRRLNFRYLQCENASPTPSRNEKIQHRRRPYGLPVAGMSSRFHGWKEKAGGLLWREPPLRMRWLPRPPTCRTRSMVRGLDALLLSVGRHPEHLSPFGQAQEVDGAVRVANGQVTPLRTEGDPVQPGQVRRDHRQRP